MEIEKEEKIFVEFNFMNDHQVIFCGIYFCGSPKKIAFCEICFCILGANPQKLIPH